MVVELSRCRIRLRDFRNTVGSPLPEDGDGRENGGAGPLGKPFLCIAHCWLGPHDRQRLPRNELWNELCFQTVDLLTKYPDTSVQQPAWSEILEAGLDKHVPPRLHRPDLWICYRVRHKPVNSDTLHSIMLVWLLRPSSMPCMNYLRFHLVWLRYATANFHPPKVWQIVKSVPISSLFSSRI